MATTAYDLKALRRLTVAERIQLVEDLWDSIAEDDPDAAFPVTPALAKELDRRMAAHERDPSAAEDWRIVRRRITNGLRTKLKQSGSLSAARRKK
ncbi:MAG: addiction module protein [Gemmatimonadaceae bacterium]